MARKLAEAQQALASADSQAVIEKLRQLETARAAERRTQTERFLQAEGLKTVEDCRRYVREKMRSGRFMRPAPREHWRRVLENPGACLVAQEMAREALKRLEHPEMADLEELR